MPQKSKDLWHGWSHPLRLHMPVQTSPCHAMSPALITGCLSAAWWFVGRDDEAAAHAGPQKEENVPSERKNCGRVHDAIEHVGAPLLISSF